MTKVAYLKKHLVGAPSSRGLEAMATVVGNTAVGRHVTGEGAESLHLIYQHVQKEERVCVNRME